MIDRLIDSENNCLLHLFASSVLYHKQHSVLMKHSFLMNFIPLLSLYRKVQQHEAETAGAVMAFFLSLGLALGAAVSFGFRAMI